MLRRRVAMIGQCASNRCMLAVIWHAPTASAVDDKEGVRESWVSDVYEHIFYCQLHGPMHITSHLAFLEAARITISESGRWKSSVKDDPISGRSFDITIQAFPSLKSRALVQWPYNPGYSSCSAVRVAAAS